MINHLIWLTDNSTPNVAELHKRKDFDNKQLFAMWQGKPLQDQFSTKAEFIMNPDFQKNTVLADTLNNTCQLIVGSARLKSFLESKDISNMEYLKIGIRDHKGKRTTEYYLINPLQPIDCIDHKASGTVFDEEIPTQVDRLKRLVLKADQIPHDRPVFRIFGYPDAIMVREDLAKGVSKAFPGIKFKKLPQTKKK